MAPEARDHMRLVFDVAFEDPQENYVANHRFPGREMRRLGLRQRMVDRIAETPEPALRLANSQDHFRGRVVLREFPAEGRSREVHGRPVILEEPIPIDRFAGRRAIPHRYMRIEMMIEDLFM